MGQLPRKSPVTPETTASRRPGLVGGSTTRRLPSLEPGSAARTRAMPSWGGGPADGGALLGVESAGSSDGIDGIGSVDSNEGEGLGDGDGDGAAFAVGFGVGFGLAVGRGVGFGGARGLAVGFGVGFEVGFGVAVEPQRSAKRTVHIFLPSGPLYAPTPITSQVLPRMFARCPADFMNALWIAAVATSSG